MRAGRKEDAPEILYLKEVERMSDPAPGRTSGYDNVTAPDCERDVNMAKGWLADADP